MTRKIAYLIHTMPLALLLFGTISTRAQDKAPASSQRQEAGADAPESITLRHTVEDWTAITLDKSELKMRPPVPGEVDQQETYTRERWQLQWRDMDPIDLYIIKPKGVEKPPVILYLYSTEVANKRPFINDGWCKRVTSGGFAAVGFVPALTEDRFQMRPMKEWFVSELQEAVAETTHDVQMVLNYLELRKDFDMERVGIFGTGSGATVGILAAAADPRIKALDLFEPWGDWPNWLQTTPLVSPIERKNYVTPEFMAKVAPLDPVKWLPKLQDQKVRILIVDEETKQTKTSMNNLEAAAPKNARIDHYATLFQFKFATAQGQSFQWVKDQLQVASSAAEHSAQTGTVGLTAKP